MDLQTASPSNVIVSEPSEQRAEISVLVPVLDEAETVKPLASQVAEVLERMDGRDARWLSVDEMKSRALRYE